MVTSRRNFINRLVLSIIFLFILFVAKSELVFTMSHERRANNWYLVRNWKLFEQRAIQHYGWDWYVDNIILRDSYIGAYMIQNNGSSGVFVFNTPYKSHDLNDAVKKIFDIMAVKNDTVCFFMESPYVQIPESEWRKIRNDKHYRDSLFDTRATQRFVQFLNFAKRISYGTWYNVQSDFSERTKAYFFHPIRINSANILSIDSIRDMYVAECQDNGLQNLLDSCNRPRLLDYNNGILLKNETKDFDLLRKYVHMDDSIVLSQPLPYTKVDVNMRYRENNHAQNGIWISYTDSILE